MAQVPSEPCLALVQTIAAAAVKDASSRAIVVVKELPAPVSKTCASATLVTQEIALAALHSMSIRDSR